MMSFLLWGLTFVAYKGIIDDHENKSSATSKLGSDSNKLAGGAYLDLLGLVVVVQFGSTLFSNKFYWILCLLPIWGGYKLYSMFFGANDTGVGNDGSQSTNEEVVDEALAEKRRKRAEKRRQKRL
eukprot:CAMPEP_0184860816 /NCGR_PEP_ID=MMETSP0580-20130426/5625_1 /TAXON_ID=1118495 /ORGANISM="Dactyliosolen fragilissimus" /LENGTH=124 /DNA_ID=CAMNT_0027358065 /DNA_START=304 /DNA_END=678 /DNA_ORIENTATION=-